MESFTNWSRRERSTQPGIPRHHSNCTSSDSPYPVEWVIRQLAFTQSGIALPGSSKSDPDILLEPGWSSIKSGYNIDYSKEGTTDRMTELILHSANLDHRLPSGSLAALELSLKAGIARIEVDIIPMKDDDFALLHDPQLEHSSNGSGSVAEQTSQNIQQLIYKNSNEFSDQIKLGTLSQAVRLLQTHSITGFLQLDLKPYAPLTPSSMQNLLNLIKPVQNKIMVSSVADWAIRILNKMASELMLGFDPLLYLDLVHDERREEGVPPFRVGAYGYLDEHPLAAQRWGALNDYFGARAEALLQQVPEGVTWFINAQLLDEAMISGFNWISYLHDHGCRVNAWTLDMDRSDLAGKMAASGVDLITTNQLPEMASFLNT